MIPEAKQAAVARALQSAFGTSDYEDLRSLTSGLSGMPVCRIVVKGAPYMLRVSPDDARGDLTNQLACLKIAASADLSPRVWYAGEDRILITDFVEARPFPPDIGLRMAPLLRRLHSLEGFGKRVPWFDWMDAGVQRLHDANLLPESRTADAFRRYGEASRVYPRDELVASHNDLNRGNILFDGTRVWFVDWEAAFLNDRYVDLGVVANVFAGGEGEADALLDAYFGAPADDHQRARFFLMSQILHMGYGALILPMEAKAGTSIDAEAHPDFDGIHRRLLSGEATLATPEARVEYALAHLDRAVRDMGSPRFDEALELVRAR